MARARGLRFSGQHQDLEEIASQHKDTEVSVRSYFVPANIEILERFTGLTPDRLDDEMRALLEEHERRSVMSILTGVEAAFRMDYYERCAQKMKDPLSRALRAIYDLKAKKASLADDIFDTWKVEGGADKVMIGELKGAMNYRDWLAHGRYWDPNLGRDYDYFTVYSLAQAIFEELEFIVPEDA